MSQPLSPSSPLRSASGGGRNEQAPKIQQQQSGSVSSAKSVTVQVVVGKRTTGIGGDDDKDGLSSFHVSWADLKRREEEMKQTAQQFSIPASRWKASRLYQASKQQQQQQEGNKREALVVVKLDPERDILLQQHVSPLTQPSQDEEDDNDSTENVGATVSWQPWLSTLLSEYYRTGQLSVPDDCQGSDLLLVLEYFGILYAPGQLVFTTYAAYQRVRCWSDYLTHRTSLADQVAERVMRLQTSRAAARESLEDDEDDDMLLLGTVLHPEEELMLADGEHIEAWGADNRSDDEAICGLIYRLFNTNDDNWVAERLRHDFGVYLQNLLEYHVDGIHVTFTIRVVEIVTRAESNKQTAPTRCPRAVLRIDLISEEQDDDEEYGEYVEEEPSAEEPSSSWLSEKSEIDSAQKMITTPPSMRHATQAGSDERRKSKSSMDQRRKNQEQPQTPTSESSPVDVAADIYQSNANRTGAPHIPSTTPESPTKASNKKNSSAKREKKDALTILPASSKGQLQRSNPPHTNMADGAAGSNRAMHDYHHQINVLAADSVVSSAVGAPLDVIYAEKLEAQTVASGLTGPVNLPSDDSISSDTAGIRAEALRHEWVQGSLLNRDISKHMRELLSEDEDEEKSSASQEEAYEITEIVSGPPGPRRQTAEDFFAQLKDTTEVLPQHSPWDWISNVCQGGGAPTTICDGAASIQDSFTPATISSPQRFINLGPQGQNMQPQQPPPQKAASFSGSRDVAARSSLSSPPATTRTQSTGTLDTGKGTSVKDRLTKVKQYEFKAASTPAPRPSSSSKAKSPRRSELDLLDEQVKKATSGTSRPASNKDTSAKGINAQQQRPIVDEKQTQTRIPASAQTKTKSSSKRPPPPPPRAKTSSKARSDSIHALKEGAPPTSKSPSRTPVNNSGVRRFWRRKGAK